MRWASSGMGLIFWSCSGDSNDTGHCLNGTGTLTVVVMGSWGVPYEGATDIRIVPEGGEGFLVSMAGSEVQVELAPGLYSISMDKNAEACLTWESVDVHIQRCQEEQVSLEIDCAL